MALTVTIAGVPRRVHFGSMTVRSTVNGIDRFTATLHILDGGAVPAIDDEVIVTEDGRREFGGHLDANAREAIIGKTDLKVDLSAKDFNAYASRRVTSWAQTTPVTVKYILQQLLPLLSPFGVTLHPQQTDGPLIPQFHFDYITVAASLDEVSKITGMVWLINKFKVLRMWTPGDENAPFPIVDGDGRVMGDIKVAPLDADYANRILLRAGPNSQVNVTDVLHGDGVRTSWPLNYPTASHFGYVRIYENFAGSGESRDESVGGAEAQWTFNVEAQTLSVNSGGILPATAQVHFPIMAQYPIVAAADHLPEQALRGMYEKVVDDQTNMTRAQADATAAGLLLRYSTRRRLVTYQTRLPGLEVGQTQLLQVARRGLNGHYLITDIETRMHEAAPFLLRSVTLQEAAHYQGSWREVYELWAGGGTGGGSGTITAGAPILITPAYFLGASAIEWVQAPAPVGWIPASAIQVQPHGLKAGMVTVRCRARAGSVTPRLWNLSTGEPAGVGPTVTNTALQTVAFPVTINEGHTYELQLLPSLPDTDVNGIGYLA